MGLGAVAGLERREEECPEEKVRCKHDTYHGGEEAASPQHTTRKLCPQAEPGFHKSR